MLFLQHLWFAADRKPNACRGGSPGALSRAGEARYIGREGKRGLMRKTLAVAAIIALAAAQIASAQAAVKKRHPRVARSAAGTVIQPTRTIIHNPDGTTTIYVTPRRSYLDTGTEVSVGDRHFRDYMLPPDGDPGRTNWFYGPDQTGSGGMPLPRPYYIPGFNPATPF
jgi:hypothetical protein